jgi:hypothetical protein
MKTKSFLTLALAWYSQKVIRLIICVRVPFLEKPSGASTLKLYGFVIYEKRTYFVVS